MGTYQSNYTGAQIDEAIAKVLAGKDSIHCNINGSWSTVANTWVPLKKMSGSLSISNGRIVIPKGKRVQINVGLYASNGQARRQACEYQIKNYTSNTVIQNFSFMVGDTEYEFLPFTACQYENNTNGDVEIGLYCTNVYTSGGLSTYSYITVQEI